MKDFKELRVWAAAHELTLCIYGLTRQFPKDEAYGLTSQVRRSAASIGANIAEGCGKKLVEVQRMLTVFVQKVQLTRRANQG